jgi:RNA polymerase sigma-70 factor, ECF subfamily
MSMQNGPPRDRDLLQAVAQAQAGDRRAFEAIYERFADPLFRYLYARCADACMAEELMGELWLRVVEHLPGFRFADGAPETVFSAWLYRIARNLVTDSYRRRLPAALPVPETLPSSEASPIDQVIASEEQREIHAAMQGLSPDHREVLLLRFIENRAPGDIALITGRTEGAVRTMQHRALGALARALGVQRRRA